jgi:hypothetical protein
MPVSDAITVAFFTAATILWGSLTVLATERVQKLVDTNLDEMKNKGIKVGRIRRAKATWPGKSLRIASRLWGLAALIFGAELALQVASSYFQPPNLDEFLFIFGLIATLLAGIETANIFEFIGNRKFQPTVTAYKGAATGLALGVLVLDFIEMLFAFAFLPHFSTLPWWLDGFAVLLVPSVIGSAPYVIRIWQRKNDAWYYVGMAGFFSPFVLLLIFGALLRVGVAL